MHELSQKHTLLEIMLPILDYWLNNLWWKSMEEWHGQPCREQMIKGCRHSRRIFCWGRICIRALPYWHTSWSCPGSITGPRLLWNLTLHLCGAGPIAGSSSRTLSAIYPRAGCAPQHRAWCVLVHNSQCVRCNAKQGTPPVSQGGAPTAK